MDVRSLALVQCSTLSFAPTVEVQIEVTTMSKAAIIHLPAPRHRGDISVEEALSGRSSVRSFTNEAITLADLSQLACACQGVTRMLECPPGWSWGAWAGGKRTAPSAGALYPLETYLLAGNVSGLGRGIYRYVPLDHRLLVVGGGDRREDLALAAHGQEWVAEAPLVFVVGVVRARTVVKYGERATRYIHIEVGHAVENICLQAVALGLGTTVVGAFKDEDVHTVVGMRPGEVPLAIVPVGRGR